MNSSNNTVSSPSRRVGVTISWDAQIEHMYSQKKNPRIPTAAAPQSEKTNSEYCKV